VYGYGFGMTRQVTAGQAPPASGDSLRSGLLQAGPLAIAGFLASALSLGVTVFMSHLLSQHGYGSLNQLLALFIIVSMPGSAVAVAVVRKVTAWSSTDAVRHWAARVHARGTLAVLVFALAVALAGRGIASALGQEHAVAPVCTLIAGAVWILLNLDRGLLQAHRNYRSLAVNLLVEAAARTAGLIGLVAAGFGVAGAAVGLMVAELVTCVHARIAADRAWSMHGAEGLKGRWRSLFGPAPDLDQPADARRQLLTDLGTAFVALGSVALLQNIDLIVVARDNHTTSGSYAAVSVACKSLVFAAIILGGYLLPEAAIRWRAGGHALRQTAVILAILAVPATILLVSSALFPRKLLAAFFPPKDLHATAAFLPLTLAMICLSVTVVMTMYLLGIGRRWVTPLLVLGGAATTVVVVRAGGHPESTAWADLATQAALVAGVLIGFVRLHLRRLREGATMGGGST
jgi:O-antigen/teichoic acid export membrane protein